MTLQPSGSRLDFTRALDVFSSNRDALPFDRYPVITPMRNRGRAKKVHVKLFNAVLNLTSTWIVHTKFRNSTTKSDIRKPQEYARSVPDLSHLAKIRVSHKCTTLFTCSVASYKGASN